MKEWRTGYFKCDIGCVASGGKINPGSNKCDHGPNNEDCLFPVTHNEGKETEEIVCDTFCGPNSGILEDWDNGKCKWDNFEYRPSKDGFF